MDLGVIHELRRPSRETRMLLKAIEDLGHRPRYVPLVYLSVRVGSGAGVGAKLGREGLFLDGALLRGFGFTPSFEQFMARISMLEGLEASGVYLMNRVQSTVRARNKFLALLELVKAGIRIPEALITEYIPEACRVAEEWERVIVKPIVGSRGLGQVLVEDVDVAFQVFKTLAQFKQPIFVEEYLEKPGRDIRLFVAGGRVVAAMYRYAPPACWKTNIAQGGRGEAMVPDSELEELAVRSAEVLGLDYAGVDVVEGQEGYVVLEINACPGFEGLMSVTGSDIPKEIVSLLVEKVRR